MAVDEALVQTLRWPERPILLRLYSWDRPAVTYGRSQHPETLPAVWRREGIPFARRPTGGGAVLHSTEELTYALAFSRILLLAGARLPDLPAHLHRILGEALFKNGVLDRNRLSQFHSRPKEDVSLCFSSPVCGDLLLDGRKAAGCAIRAWKQGILVQGTLQGIPVSFSMLAEILRQSVSHLLIPMISRDCFDA